MADVVGVVFHNGAKTYHFDPAGLELSRGDRVVVQTMKGTEIGQVVDPPHVVDDSELPAPLKKVLRVATGEDLQKQVNGDSLRKEAMAKCREMIASHGLDMKLVDADVSFGGEKITFSFYSDERVDFRALVADLAHALKMRIELRQIGAREEARMVGGLGPCGRHLCCSLFQGDEDPVSIRMAKEQNLPLNPMKISGLCGRLMCCLKYEQDQYVTFRKEAPPKGTQVQTGDTTGVIVGYNVLKDSIVVRFEDGSVSDVKLSTCECDEDGCLRCCREVAQPRAATALDAGFGGAAEPAEAATVGLFGAGADEESGARAPAPEAAGPEGEAKTEGRPRSRRGRGRRAGGRGRGPNGAVTGGAEVVPTAEAGSHTKGAQRGRVGGGSGETEAGAAKRPRKRRRPRRRGSGPGDGGGNGGDGASGGGEA